MVELFDGDLVVVDVQFLLQFIQILLVALLCRGGPRVLSPILSNASDKRTWQKRKQSN